MAKQSKTPIIEVVIRDEVSAGLDRMRQRIAREGGGREMFKGFEQGFERLGAGARVLQREFASLLGVTGIGAFVGGGFVIGIAKVTESLAGLARGAQQTKYTAEALGMSVATMNRLTVRGMAIGQSEQEAQASVKGLTEGIQNMIVHGQKSQEWQRLMKGKGGERFGRELMAAYKGGGAEEAARYMSERMSNMSLSGQRALTEMFHLGTGFKDLFKTDQSELAEIFQLSEPEARRFAISMANLNIEFENIKKTVAVAVMPIFERMATGLSTFMQGPGGQMAKEFGAWLKGIDIDWDKIATGIGKILDAIVGFFQSMAAVLKDMDPIVQKMGGWKVLVGGLAIILGTAGLAGWLTSVGTGLKLIAAAAFVVPLLVTSAAAAPAAATAPVGSGSVPMPRPRTRRPGVGGGGARRGPLELPPVDVDEDTSIPEAAGPTSGGPGGSGYYIPGRGRTNTSELRSTVRGLKTEMASLGGFISNMPSSDQSGAGNIAGFSGVLRRLSAPMGGGGGGGGGGRVSPGMRRRSGGGGWRGPGQGGGEATGSSTQGVGEGLKGSAFLQAQRASRIEEINGNPATKRLLMQMLATESGIGTRGSTATMEALINRSIMVGNTIEQELRSGFYGPINKGIAQRRALSTNEQRQAEATIAEVAGGSNLIRGRTDQGSGNDPNVRGPGRVPVAGTGEVFNYWKGRRGGRDFSHADAARFANEQERQVAAGGDAPRVTIGQPDIAGEGPAGGTGTGGKVVQAQAEAATRKGAIDPRLDAALKYASDQSGLTVRVTSGGQRMAGAPGATGSHRHDQGKAADFDLIDPATGNIVPRNDPRRLAFIEAASRAGAGGAGYGYMSDSRKLHMGITGSRSIVGEGLGAYAGSAAERDATLRGIRQSGTFDPSKATAKSDSPAPILVPSDDELVRRQHANLFSRARASNMGLKIRVRGPRGVRVSSESSGSVSPATIERSMDATGGGQIESPA